MLMVLGNLNILNQNLTIEEDNEEKTTNYYDKLKVSDLKRICKERKIKGYSKLRKNELIELLKNNN